MSNQTNEEIFDLENIILRLPDRIGEQLSNDLSQGSRLEDKLSIKFGTKYRQCTIRYNNEKLKGTIVDLPNEACTMKTIDCETYTNISTIKHMILCQLNTCDTKKPYDKDFVLRHGLSGPLKNINCTKYRKPKKNRTVEMMNLIKELIQADSAAESLWYKVVDESVDKEIELRDKGHILNQCRLIEEEKRKHLDKNKKEDESVGSNDKNESDDDTDSDSDSDSLSSASDGGGDSDISNTDDDFEDI